MNNSFELIDHIAVIAMGFLHLIAISFLSNEIGSDFYRIIFYSDLVSDALLIKTVNATAIAIGICVAGWIILMGEKIWKHISLKNRQER